METYPRRHVSLGLDPLRQNGGNQSTQRQNSFELPLQSRSDLRTERISLFELLNTAGGEYAKAASLPSNAGELGRVLAIVSDGADAARSNAQRAYAAFLNHIADHGCWREISKSFDNRI